jgi:hypothetical protein
MQSQEIKYIIQMYVPSTHAYIYIYICNEKSDNIDFKDLAEVLEKLIFNNLHNHPPTKYFDIIINPLYSKQLLVHAIRRQCHKKNL